MRETLSIICFKTRCLKALYHCLIPSMTKITISYSLVLGEQPLKALQI